MHTHKLTHRFEKIDNLKVDKTKTEPKYQNKFLHNWMSDSHILGMLT